MDNCFQESFFDSSSSESEDSEVVCQTKVVYNARRCEQQWFLAIEAPTDDTTVNESSEAPSIHSSDFAISKHKADLFYYQSKYEEAAKLYKKVLLLVPSNNQCVTRETRDALARCYLRLGEGELAKKEAEKLVLPPHEKDWTAWMLLGQCHQLLQEYEAQVIALQTSAALQRCHSNFWIALSEAYEQLRGKSYCDVRGCRQSQNLASKSCGAGVNTSSADNLRTILTNTVQLFRPYFSWRRTTQTVSSQTAGQLDDTDKNAVEEVTRELDSIIQIADPQSDCNSEHCVFRDVSLSRDTSAYQSILLQPDISLLVPQEAALIPDLSVAVCLHHCPFVMLVRQLVAPDVFVWLRTQHVGASVIPTSVCSNCLAGELLDSVYVMAKCSCLVWARKILLYSVRHSHSFPNTSLQAQLREVDARLDNCHTQTTDYITSHFTKRTVFEEH